MKDATRSQWAAVLMVGVLGSGCGQLGSTDGPASSNAKPEFRTERLALPGLPAQDITYEVIDGRAFFHGDIEIEVAKYRVPAGDISSRTLGLVTEVGRWTNAVVPYVIDSSLPPSDPRVTAAISHWEANTPVRFQQRTSQPDFVKFTFNTLAGMPCTSQGIGRIGGQQLIRLKPECQTAAVIHEIGHAMGLFHEQQRADRNNSVVFFQNNCNCGSQFTTTLGGAGEPNGPFDFASIMLYGSTDCSNNGRNVMVKNIAGCNEFSTSSTCVWSQSSTLSTGDVAGIGRLYPRFNTFAFDSMPATQSNFRPAIVSWGKDRLDVFAVGLDGHLLHQFSNGPNHWSGWIDDFGGVLTSGITATSWGANRLDVVGRGTDDNLWHWTWDNGNLGWRQIPASFSIYDPAITTMGAGTLDLFSVGSNHEFYHTAFRNGGWLFHENSQGGYLTAGVDAVSWGPNRMDMVSRNSADQLVHKAYTGSWSPWTARGNSLAGTPTITSSASNRFDIFGPLTDGNVWKRSYHFGWELDWGSSGGGPLTDIDVTSDGLGRFDIVGRQGTTVVHGRVRSN